MTRAGSSTSGSGVVGKAMLDYFRRSELPLASLLFLLPLIVAFEVASRYYTSADPIAFWMIGRFFRLVWRHGAHAADVCPGWNPFVLAYRPS